MRLSRWRETTIAVLASLTILSCGGGSDEDARDLAARSILEDPPPLERALVRESQIEKLDFDSPERAFLQLWRSLQYQAWLDAVLAYTPALRQALGDAQLTEALKGQAAYFRSVKPSLRETINRGRGATIHYVITDVTGRRTPRSVSLVERSGGWKVSYDPFLDEALRDAAQRAAQTEIDPLARTPDEGALEAGATASRLQSTYLDEALGRPLSGFGDSP